MAEPGPVQLQVTGAARWFGQHRVFSGLDLTMPPGVRLFLGGSNGSGKTTLLRCLAGTLTLTVGRITIAGSPAGSSGARRAVGLCLAPEQGLYGNLSGAQNLLLVARLRLPRPAATRAVGQILREFDIDGFADVPVERCSAGMRARISIARALLGEPSVLLLDEPSRSLDDRARDLLWAALDRRPQLTCVVASHLEEDRNRCQRTLTLPVHG